MTNKVARLSQAAFACSGVPTTGIISNGIDYFLFFFYSQVIGLSAALTGLALAIALAFDALFNPLVGYLSDHWRSRLGRRHPFMYASILPLSALYVLVWYPPGSHTQWVLFGYLLTVLVLLRLSMAMFDAPVRTLVAELTPDYDERTRLASLPTSASWFVGSVMTIAMYAVWLKDTPAHLIGQTNIAGYQQAALVCGGVILLSLLFSTVGLHPEIPHLHRMGSSDKAAGLREMARSFGQLWQNRSMRALVLSSLFVGTGLGATAALWIYQYGFFYGMRSEQMSTLTVVESLASFAVVPVIRQYVVKGDKKIMAIRFLGASVAISLILPPLLCLNLLPERGSKGLWFLLTTYDFLSQLMWIVTASIIYSLYADVTDEVVLRSGKRLEGAIFACQTLVDRAATALGALLAGLLLTLIHYPTGADSAPISGAVLTRLGLSYMVVWFVFASIGIWFISRYEITRSLQAAEVAQPGAAAR